MLPFSRHSLDHPAPVSHHGPEMQVKSVVAGVTFALLYVIESLGIEQLNIKNTTVSVRSAPLEHARRTEGLRGEPCPRPNLMPPPPQPPCIYPRYLAGGDEGLRALVAGRAPVVWLQPLLQPPRRAGVAR